ncbi:MAG: hypothetical protein IPO09_19570 [Anaeromyxobacter sp.]|nr:hypothetical protein [Anaeromyxobacter sp.]MBL0275919.1 hypothetical protein [Anaeromyxobacter sp.]
MSPSPTPRHGAPAGQDPAPWPARAQGERLREVLPFLLQAPLRHRALALGAALLLCAVGLAARLVVPVRWEVRARVLAQQGSAAEALTMPDLPGVDDAPAHAVREVVTRESNILAICRQTRFVERYLAGRAPAVRARDWLLDTLRGRERTPDEVLDLLVDTLQDRLVVEPDKGETVTIAFAWTDQVLALDIVEAAVQSFMEDRHLTEVQMATEMAAILEDHDERIQQEIQASIQRLAERGRQLGAPGLAPGLRARAAREDELSRLEGTLGERRQAMAALEQGRARRATELQVHLDRALATFAPDHPAVRSTRQALDGMAGPSTQLHDLRLEVETLERQVLLRSGRAEGGPGAPSSFLDAVDPAGRLGVALRDVRLETESRRLDHLMRAHSTRLERIAAARMTLAMAASAFKYRYSVVAPPRVPRDPVKPYGLLFLGGGLVGGLALALFLSAAVDVRAGRLEEPLPAAPGQGLQAWREVAWAPDLPSPDLPAPAAPGRLAFWALLAGVSAATAAAVVAGAGPVLAAVPAALAAGAWVVSRLPLRWSVAGLIYLSLGIDAHGESTGQWRTPFAIIGDLLQERLDAVTGLPGLSVTGLEVVGVLLLALWARRRVGGSTLDDGGRVRGSALLPRLLVLTVAAVLFAEAVGLASGQGLVPWKLRNYLHPVLLFLLFDAAFRGPIDHRLVGRVVVAAAATRALLALIVQRLSIAEYGGKFAVATSHGDSVLFATAAFLLLADLTERADRGRLLRTALLLPLLVVGMLENGRRLVWVMVLMVLLVGYLTSPMLAWKRRLTRLLLVALPALVLYVAVGWNSASPLFAPVLTLRSVADTSYDHSAYWREVENWNIAMSIRERPLMGLGLGGRYTEHMANDDISSIYKEYREWPHNTVLGQFMLLGLFGFTAVWALFAGGLFLAFRSLRVATEPDHRVAALGCIGALVACHMLGYGDTGAHYTQYKLLAALALALAGKLAVACGAWPRRA